MTLRVLMSIGLIVVFLSMTEWVFYKAKRNNIFLFDEYGHETLSIQSSSRINTRNSTADVMSSSSINDIGIAGRPRQVSQMEMHSKVQLNKTRSTSLGNHRSHSGGDGSTRSLKLRVDDVLLNEKGFNLFMNHSLKGAVFLFFSLSFSFFFWMGRWVA